MRLVKHHLNGVWALNQRRRVVSVYKKKNTAPPPPPLGGVTNKLVGGVQRTMELRNYSWPAVRFCLDTVFLKGTKTICPARLFQLSSVYC